MSQQNQRIAYLLDAYTSRKATAQEEQELMDWMHEAQEDAELKTYIQSLWDQHNPGTDFNYVNWDRMFDRVVKSDNAISIASVPKRKTVSWFRVAAAASVILAISIGAYVIYFNKPEQTTAMAQKPVQHDVKAPTANRAMITLTNGNTVYLDSVTNGQFAAQGSVKLVKFADGEIAYQTTGGDMVKKLEYNTLYNPQGSKVIDMKLADGSHVWLNAGSSVTFPVAFVGNERNVSVDGEAYFEVTHNAKMPFKVTHDKTEVTVLGTHFNVNAYNNEPDIKVTLLEGSVNVSNGAMKQQLKPGQQAQIKNDIKVTDDVDVDLIMAWKNGLFSFKATGIEEMMRQIARWYDVTVKYEGKIPAIQFGGKIHRSANISQVLKILEESDVHYRINGKEILIMQ